MFIHKIVKLGSVFEYLKDQFWAHIIKRAMGFCGKNVMLRPSTSVFKGIENFYFEGDIRIARYAVIYSTNARVTIGKKVGIAPYLKIITGNHRFDAVGHFMFDSDFPKRVEDDKDVYIEGDCWIGIGVTILAGVKIGRGSIIGAGSVVNRSCPPYSILGGVPAKVLKYRFTIPQIVAHEKLLYSEKERLNPALILAERNMYDIKNN